MLRQQQSSTKHSSRIVLLVLASWVLIELASAHGGLIGINGDISGSTGSRSYATHKLMHGSLREWNPYSLNGVDGRVDQTNNACGEPGQTQHAQLQYTSIGKDIEGNSWDGSQMFAAGEPLKFRVAITANHGGIHELRYTCTDGMDLESGSLQHLDFYDKASTLTTAAECYSSNSHSNIWRDGDGCYQPRTLKRANVHPTSKTYHPSHPEWYMLPQATANECWDPAQASGGAGVGFDLEYQLPTSLTGCSRIIVQWWYQTSNSCIPQAWRDWKADGSFPCSSDAWPTWSMPTCNAAVGTKSGSGEQFVNCVDFNLESSTPATNPTESPTTIAPGSPTSSPTDDSVVPVSDGICYTNQATGNWCDQSEQSCAQCQGVLLQQAAAGYCAFRKGEPCQGSQQVCNSCTNSVWIASTEDPTTGAPTSTAAQTQAPTPAHSDAPTSSGNDAEWAGTLKATHFWDCSGMGCDATTLQPWNQDRYIAAPGYSPIDPDEHGGALHGEKGWMVGAASDTLAELLGPDDGCCGSDNDSTGCGKCVLVQNPDAVNADWSFIIMKKNRCPPWSNGCEAGKAHLDMAVPGFDNLAFSTANVCSEKQGTLFSSKEQSAALGDWYQSCSNTIECIAKCDLLPSQFVAGCRLFASWGWTSGDPSGINYKPVECPAKFTELVAAQFNADGVTTGPQGTNPTSAPSTQPPSAPTPAPGPGSHGCSWDGGHTCAQTTDYCKATQNQCEQNCGGQWITCSTDDSATQAPTTLSTPTPTTASTQAPTTLSTQAPTTATLPPTLAPTTTRTEAPSTSGSGHSGGLKEWQRCGGQGFTGNTNCAIGCSCVVESQWNSNCRRQPPNDGTVGLHGQCGGDGWSGLTVCDVGLECVQESQWYAACIPDAFGC